LGKLYQERTSVTLVNDTTKTVDLTVPSGKRWVIHALRMENGDDVTRVLDVHIIDGSGNVLHKMANESVGAGIGREMINHHPTAVAGASPWRGDILVKAGNKLRLVWNAGGASSGGTGYYMLTYEEMVE